MLKRVITLILIFGVILFLLYKGYYALVLALVGASIMIALFFLLFKYRTNKEEFKELIRLFFIILYCRLVNLFVMIFLQIIWLVNYIIFYQQINQLNFSGDAYIIVFFIILLIYIFPLIDRITYLKQLKELMQKQKEKTSNQLENELGYHLVVFGKIRRGKDLLMTLMSREFSRIYKRQIIDRMEEIKIMMSYLDFNVVDEHIKNYYFKSYRQIDYVNKLIDDLDLYKHIGKYFDDYIKVNLFELLLIEYVELAYFIRERDSYILSTGKMIEINDKWSKIFDIKDIEIYDNNPFRLDKFQIYAVTEGTLEFPNYDYANIEDIKKNDKGKKDFFATIGHMGKETSRYATTVQNVDRYAKLYRQLITDYIKVKKKIVIELYSKEIDKLKKYRDLFLKLQEFYDKKIIKQSKTKVKRNIIVLTTLLVVLVVLFYFIFKINILIMIIPIILFLACFIAYNGLLFKLGGKHFKSYSQRPNKLKKRLVACYKNEKWLFSKSYLEMHAINYTGEQHITKEVNNKTSEDIAVPYTWYFDILDGYGRYDTHELHSLYEIKREAIYRKDGYIKDSSDMPKHSLTMPFTERVKYTNSKAIIKITESIKTKKNDKTVSKPKADLDSF